MQVGDTIEFNGKKYIVNTKLAMMEWLLCENLATRRSCVIRIKDYLFQEAERRKLAESSSEAKSSDSGVICEMYDNIYY